MTKCLNPSLKIPYQFCIHLSSKKVNFKFQKQKSFINLYTLCLFSHLLSNHLLNLLLAVKNWLSLVIVKIMSSYICMSMFLNFFNLKISGIIFIAVGCNTASIRLISYTSLFTTMLLTNINK